MHLKLKQLKILVLALFYIYCLLFNLVNNLLSFLEFVKTHCDYLYTDRATRCPNFSGRPGARIFQGWPGKFILSPDFFFVARNSLKYEENSYFIAYFRVKICPSFVL